jgi:uncharacterized membrane protein YkvA (DUF1232 family)
VARVLIVVAATLVLLWLALIAYVWIAKPNAASARDAVRMIPDIVRLVRRIAADRSLPRGVRVRLWLLLGYLAFPIDLVPDVIPGLGYADDVVIAAAVLRSVVRRAGPDAVRRHWPGTDAGLSTLWRLTRLPGRP